MKWTPKNIALIVMCGMLLITVVMAGVVIGKVAPIMGAMMNPPEPVVPSDPTNDTTVPTTDPIKPTTKPEATDPAHVHDYVELVLEQKATCTRAGYSIYACDCGSTHMQDHVDAKGHSYGAGQQVKPTCTEEGYTLRKCTVCGDQDKRDVKDALGHDHQLVDSQIANCEQGGFEEYKCSRCDDTKKENVVEAAGHDYELKETHEPTCTVDGYEKYICSVCEQEKEEVTEEKTGHDFGDWEVEAEPSAGNPGEETRVCKVCEEKETRACELSVNPQKTDTAEGYHYIVTVCGKDLAGKDVVVYTYDIYDHGRFADMHFTYDAESGLIVTFTDAEGNPKTYAVEAGNTSLILNEEGLPGMPNGSGTEEEPGDEE